MKTISALALSLLLCAGSAFAQTASIAANTAEATPASCEARAVDKNGKALSGAAKAASIKKCSDTKAKVAAAIEAPIIGKPGANAVKAADPKTAACELKALSAAGKPLAGAAKNASVKKCLAAAK